LWPPVWSPLASRPALWFAPLYTNTEARRNRLGSSSWT